MTVDQTLKVAQDLIRIDTTNSGGGNAVGEQRAAEYVEAYLADLGIASQLFESAPRRTNLVAHVPGRNPDKPPLVVHGHLDVVPAIAEDWSVDPFAAEVRDGMLWGRGAVDMKNMNAMILTSLAELAASGEQPGRDLVVAFFADEEDGGRLGSHYMVSEHPQVFRGADTAVSEVGGYSVQVGNERAYLIQTGEKAMMWVTIRARAAAAHGSLQLTENAIVHLAQALVRLDAHEWSLEYTETTRTLLGHIAQMLNLEFDEANPEQLVANSGVGSGFIRASLRTTANVTMLEAGYKHNVVPDVATARIDLRMLPGREGETLETLRRLLGDDIEVEIVHQDIGMEAPFAGSFVDSMVSSLRDHDPEARVIPYLLPAGTDNKALSRIGIDGYGFVPMQLPSDYNFVSMFHGVDERIPVEALSFGRRVLTDLLRRHE